MPQLTMHIAEALAPAEPRFELPSPGSGAEQRCEVERWFMRLSYRGDAFCGWQRQPHDRSVQQRLEESLETVLRRPVKLTGAGRTDTGVNARNMWAHFDLLPGEVDPKRLLVGVDRLSGNFISVHELRRVRNDANARFDAISRTYRYFVAYEKSPFISPFALHVPRPLDVEAMNRCGRILRDVSDFTSFAKLHSDAKTNICRLDRAEWTPWETDSQARFPIPGLVFTITADRFLRNMVRAVVGTLLDVGRRKLSESEFVEIIGRKDRCAAGQSVAAEALFLWDVRYPDSIWIP